VSLRKAILIYFNLNGFEKTLKFVEKAMVDLEKRENKVSLFKRNENWVFRKK